ncbi:S8/S53 family peptidase [Enhygromyxa salina]|uniref:Peptidase S8/S53 domain-containing protein n=1 Tax=Enhygromyxa salina TaxID=215803 RepID=A0A2S9XM48_9BACT|nr:S8/S53 family peptidase [Enhygromyxa salina]PRP93949.1 hypothetical protein ENSA7_78930 [Enhygromyxa salina]
MTHELAKTLLISIFTVGLGACDKPTAPQAGSTKADGIADPAAINAAAAPSLVGASGKGCPPAGATKAPQGQLCPKGRVVGYFGKSKGCPSPYKGAPPKDKYWKVEPMFKGSATLAATKGSPLGHYCRYVWIEAGSAPGEGSPDRALLDALPGKLGPDCRVFPQSPLARDLGPHYERAFAEGTEPVDTSGLAVGYPVRLEIVDTAPTQTLSGQADHGPTLAAIAAKLASGCAVGLGQPSCRRLVETQLGLPQTRTGPDLANGGYYGYQSDLAEGVMRALDVINGVDTKLVVNLSVGWEPTPGEFANPSPAVQAVRDTIGAARCSGALVVAASGNRPQGTCMSEAVSPGAWAGEPGLDAAACNGLGVQNPVLGQAPYPFLHAATPLSWSGGNLADFREGSNAQLAAVGFAGFADGKRQYGPITGSSVSTVVVSAIATLVWSNYPDRGADEIMGALYGSGIATGRNADLALPSNSQIAPPRQRQVTACRALQHACQAWSGDQNAALTNCALSLFQTCANSSQAPVVDVGAWRQGFDTALGSAQVGQASGPTWTARTCSGCDNRPKYMKRPQGSAAATTPLWVVPQPHKAPCPMCKIKSDNVYLSLETTYDGMSLQNMSIQLYDATGASEVLYYDAANLPTLSSTQVQELKDPELLSVNPGTTGTTGTTGTVGTTGTSGGQPPVAGYIQMEFRDGTVTVVAGNQIDVQ